MFERGTVVWAAGSPCNVIARLRNDRHVLVHYLLGLYLMCGVSGVAGKKVILQD